MNTRLPVMYMYVYPHAKDDFFRNSSSNTRLHEHVFSCKKTAVTHVSSVVEIEWDGMYVMHGLLDSAAGSQNVCHAWTIGQCCRLTECK